LIMSTMGVATRKRSRGVDESDDAGTKLMPLEEAVPPLHAMRQTSRTRRATGGGEASPGGKGDESDYDEAGEADDKKKKYCFVWTAQLHQRFEAAVRKLGVSHAKPQAIRQLMGCDGEAALPTRQNIKSHLQKYRLLVQKQAVAAQQASSSARPESRMPASFPFAQMHVEGASDCQPTTHESKISPMMQRQQIGLLAQLDVHTRLASQLILQRRTQHAIAQRINASGKPALSREQLQRLAQHVLVQRQMLQHLFSLLHACSVDMCGMGTEQRYDADGYRADGYRADGEYRALGGFRCGSGLQAEGAGYYADGGWRGEGEDCGGQPPGACFQQDAVARALQGEFGVALGACVSRSGMRSTQPSREQGLAQVAVGSATHIEVQQAPLQNSVLRGPAIS